MVAIASSIAPVFFFPFFLGRWPDVPGVVPVDWLVDWVLGLVVGWLVDGLLGMVVGWLVDGLLGLMVGWLVDGPDSSSSLSLPRTGIWTRLDLLNK